MKLQYIITQDKAEHIDKINFKYINLQPPKLIIDYQEIPLLFSQVFVNNSCSELWEVHGFCYKCINIKNNNFINK